MITWTFNLPIFHCRDGDIEYYMEDIVFVIEEKKNPYITVTKWV